MVLRAKPINEGAPTNELQYAPHPIEEVVETIRREKPGVVFAPHVETSIGMILPDDYIKQMADAVRLPAAAAPLPQHHRARGWGGRSTGPQVHAHA